MKILHLTLKKKWFDLIASGEKRHEYRDIKPYWTKRLKLQFGYKWYDEIHFKNGYRKTSPFMRVRFQGVYQTVVNKKGYYCICLGEILEIRNYNTGSS